MKNTGHDQSPELELRVDIISLQHFLETMDHEELPRQELQIASEVLSTTVEVGLVYLWELADA